MVDGRKEWFSRNELQVVDDPTNLIKPRQREDIMFGQTFMKDAHLRQLHGDAQQQVLDEDQAKVEEEETPPVTRAMAQKVDEVLPDAPEAPTGERQSKRLQAQKSKSKKRKREPTKVIGVVLKNMPGSLVQDPNEKRGVSLRGLVLRAVVVGRTKKGRYLVDIAGSVPVAGGYEERDDLELLDRKGMTAGLVAKVRGMTVDQASDFGKRGISGVQ